MALRLDGWHGGRIVVAMSFMRRKDFCQSRVGISIPSMRYIKFDSDNLIYNRFDLIHAEDYQLHQYKINGDFYQFQSFCNNGIVELNVWGKEIPQLLFERMIKDLFDDGKVYAVKIMRGRNQYLDFLERTNDIRVPIPENMEVLKLRIKKKGRATIKREYKWLGEQVGDVKLIYHHENIPDDIVQTFFAWKKKSHGMEYKQTPREYIDDYFVTDALVLEAGDMEAAVLFYCKEGEIAYLENFSYNPDLKKYSPGTLIYLKLIEKLIEQNCKFLYLGGGSYLYKSRFGTEEACAYSGIIYRPEIIEGIDAFFRQNNVDTVAFYGYGVCGHAFMRISKNLKISVRYGIDRNIIDDGNVEMYSLNGILPETDASVITLNDRNEEVEEYLASHFKKVFYWNDILSKVIDDYYRF